MSDLDHYYVVKVKHEAKEEHEENYSEYSYRIAEYPSELPSCDDDLGFLGFSGDYDVQKNDRLRSYVCTETQLIKRGSRKEGELKRELCKEPWERTSGGV